MLVDAVDLDSTGYQVHPRLIQTVGAFAAVGAAIVIEEVSASDSNLSIFRLPFIMAHLSKAIFLRQCILARR